MPFQTEIPFHWSSDDETTSTPSTTSEDSINPNDLFRRVKKPIVVPAGMESSIAYNQRIKLGLRASKYK